VSLQKHFTATTLLISFPIKRLSYSHSNVVADLLGW